MKFRRLSELSQITLIARGTRVDVRAFLDRTFGRGDWRKLKGVATVEDANGQIWEVEIHLTDAP